MHWPLDQVRDLNEDEYDEVIAWAKDRAERSKGEDGSIDVDKLVDASKAKDTDAG